MGAHSNKMVVNMIKTKELVFHRPSPKQYVPPIPLFEVELVREAKLLGVYFSDTFSMERHVNYVLQICAQRSYLLKLLRKQGLSTFHLHTVFNALIMSRMLYAASSFQSFLTASQVDRINSFLKRMFRYGFNNNLEDFRTIVNEVDHTLFVKICHSTHCLNHLLPPVKLGSLMGLRPKGHLYTVSHSVPMIFIVFRLFLVYCF